MNPILAIDYGDARVGLAISDPERKLARRLLTLQNTSSLLEEIKEIITENSISEIVVGLPIGLKGENKQTEKVRVFISELEKNIAVPVYKFNEVMTSRMAQENLISAGYKNIKELIDQEAARIILQDYLGRIE